MSELKQLIIPKDAPDYRSNRTNTIVHPRYGCAIGAVYSVAAIPGGVPIANCGPGCADKQYVIMSSGNGYQGASGAGAGAMPSVNVGENEVVFGGAKKLDAHIKSALRIMKGDLFVVLTGCSGELVGDDVGAVARKYQEAGKPVVYANTAGFKGNNLKGHEIVVREIIDQYIGEYRGAKNKRLVNLWTGAPYFSTHWRGEYMEIKRILEGAGFNVNVLFGSGSGGVREWKTIPRARFNLVLHPWLGLDIAKHLEQKYGQPFLHIPIIPIGEEATSAFIQEIVRFSGIDPSKSERFIAAEAREYYYFLEHFSEFLSEYWFGVPSAFAVVAEAGANLAITKFMADQMGMVPVKQIITDDTPEAHRKNIASLYQNITEGISASVEFLEDGYLIEQAIKHADFGASAPLVFGSSWEQDVVRERRGLLIKVGTPIQDEVVLNRGYVGYRGALSLIEKVYSKAVGG
jgi:nitrogenase molybdenum-iron protein beta chain